MRVNDIVLDILAPDDFDLDARIAQTKGDAEAIKQLILDVIRYIDAIDLSINSHEEDYRLGFADGVSAAQSARDSRKKELGL